MVILCDDDMEPLTTRTMSKRRFRSAPPVAKDIRNPSGLTPSGSVSGASGQTAGGVSPMTMASAVAAALATGNSTTVESNGKINPAKLEKIEEPAIIQEGEHLIVAEDGKPIEYTGRPKPMRQTTGGTSASMMTVGLGLGGAREAGRPLDKDAKGESSDEAGGLKVGEMIGTSGRKSARSSWGSIAAGQRGSSKTESVRGTDSKRSSLIKTLE
jgi:hypothetical protein